MGSLSAKEDGTPDDVTGLTANQIRHIRETWQVVLSNKRANGFAIFRILFTDYPFTKKLFRSMDQVDIDVPEQFEKNIALRAHITRFLHSFDTYVSSLDEPADLQQLLYDTGKSHLRHSVKPEYFDALGNVLMKGLTAVLGKDFTEEVQGAWGTAWGFFVIHLKQGLEDAVRHSAETNGTAAGTDE
ncbi:cytoglobin-2-like [Branchiostoma floridae]|uniref:Cytoglobin-2-like n=1 Tax=Branchiostoma floridae TaxID=7739 RepID=A0A9J7LFZ9_BRAFL|nr:cytoglobin-2-like [Branchiostoma floridae]XP_035682117.1 cytoglobin-2-like [Branchiostoma floridae]XP_035682118.1 cytoglobin-2-like [Branchiostoma floridae]XP_035682119.1 cytoglobin-2-like [Branchiostoma floridae]